MVRANMTTTKSPSTSKAKAAGASAKSSSKAGAQAKADKPARKQEITIDTSKPLGAYFAKNKLDPKRVVRLSRGLEALTPEDRGLLEKRQAHRRKKGDSKDTYQSLSIGKPRSGRPLTADQLGHALAGEDLTNRVRGKILRAVAKALGGKGEPAEVKVDELFGRPKAAQKAQEGTPTEAPAAE